MASMKDAPARPPSILWRTWWRFRGWFNGKAEAARVFAQGQAALSEAAETIAKLAADTARRVDEIHAETRRAELEASSARAVITERDREIALLNGEKAALESELALRVLEVEELNEWLERYRARLRADTAEEVAREHRALSGTTRAAANNSGPS